MYDKPDSKPVKSGLLYYLAGCAAILFVSLVVFYIISLPLPHPPLWQIKRITKLPFPNSSRVIDSHGRRFLGIGIWAKIEMDKADLKSFTGSFPGSPHPSDSNRIASIANNITCSCWNPDKVKNPVYYDFGRLGAGHYNIVISTGRPDKAIVYLRYL